MDKNIKNLLKGELHCSTSYLDRIFHALTETTDLGHLPRTIDLTQNYVNDLHEFLEEQVLQRTLTFSGLPNSKISTKNAIQFLNAANNLIEGLIVMNFNSFQVLDMVVDYINFTYDYAYLFHQICFEGSEIEVQYPRLAVVDVDYGRISEDEEEMEVLPQFQLDRNKVEQIINFGEAKISSLDWQRDKKYNDYLSSGHHAIYLQNHKQALDKFSKALSIKQTAEALTLVGWANSLLGHFEVAKSYCLKAIQLEPDYGPPYNDLGTYLLNDGQIDESFKWFNLAKKSVQYQNREYPYINSGRAYLAKKEYLKALEEFQKALALAPYHDELRNTVRRLEGELKKTGELSHSGDSGHDFNYTL